MTSVQKTEPARPTTPSQARSSSSRFLSAPAQLLPIQPAGVRPMPGIGPISPVNENGSFAFDRVIKSGEVKRRLKKKGGWKSSWKTAYLVLRPNLLSVYKDQDETELRASITLSDVTAVAPVKKSNHEHVFGIFTPAKNYHFSGLSARQTSDWITLIRMEARTEEQDDLQLPNAGFKQADGQGYETTDLSADDDADAPGSPEAPRWPVRGQKSRVAPQVAPDPRRTSGLAQYSGNESFATSQSDISDGLSSSVPGPKSYLSAPLPIQPSSLTPIPDDVPGSSRSKFNRGVSNMSDNGVSAPQPLSKSAPKPVAQPSQADPSRVVRQGHLKLLKTVSGVRQWKTIWMVLRTQALAVYKSNSEYTPLFILPTYAIIEAAEIDRKHRQNCFQVIGEEKIYRLQAETEDELESWLGAFKSVLVKQEAERSSRHASMSNAQASQGDRQGQAVATRRPSSRDGIGAIASQMRSVSLENQGTITGGRRVLSPPAMEGTAHTQVTHLAT